MAGWDWDFGRFDRNPWRELERIRRRGTELFGALRSNVFGAPFPQVNVWSDDEKAVVTAEVPGVKAEDLDLSVEGEVLTISGSREPVKIEEGERCRRHERGHGAFSRTISLPFAVDADRVEASYVNGVLRVTLPRSESSKPKKVAIKG